MDQMTISIGVPIADQLPPVVLDLHQVPVEVESTFIWKPQEIVNSKRPYFIHHVSI